jgi:hypothetical protein
MHRPLGYSVRWKGLHHTGFKNSYIVSGMLKGASAELSELTWGKETLFTEFTLSWEPEFLRNLRNSKRSEERVSNV